MRQPLRGDVSRINDRFFVGGPLLIRGFRTKVPPAACPHPACPHPACPHPACPRVLPTRPARLVPASTLLQPLNPLPAYQQQPINTLGLLPISTHQHPAAPSLPRLRLVLAQLLRLKPCWRPCWAWHSRLRQHSTSRLRHSTSILFHPVMTQQAARLLRRGGAPAEVALLHF